MHRIDASAIPMSQRLPKLRAYLHTARRMVADPAVSDRVRDRLRARIVRLESDIAVAASTR